jgi:erythronate-4-phosphate dehydrogenase
MRIIADENIPYAVEAYSTLGEVVLAPGRGITRAMLEDADVLVVRSITKVNAELLDGTRVQFVGTCTIGEDHIDKVYLASRGIAFSSAPGCNANSVGQYLVATLLHLAEKHGIAPEGMKLGIVGVGNVGKRVYFQARALGFSCVLHDPPLAETTGDPIYRPIEEVLGCDIVTLHVPLARAGAHPTRHLVDETFLAKMRDGAFLINSSRGAVVDNQALKRALAVGKLRGTVLDVWEGEPNPDTELLERVDLGTPHIAGYSFEGKVNGTRQILEALCAHFGTKSTWEDAVVLPPPSVPDVAVDGASRTGVADAVRKVYDVRDDDAAMRRMLAVPGPERGAFFDVLRKAYPVRREFFNTRATVAPKNGAVEAALRGIGFEVFR